MDYPLSKNEVLIKVEMCGICKSDVDAFTGKKRTFLDDVVFGHEFIGHVTEHGSEVNPSIMGKRVVVNPLVNCSSCKACVAGTENLCERFSVVGFGKNGGIAEFSVQRTDCVHIIDEKISAQRAVLIEPIAVAINAAESWMSASKSRLVLVGGGTIGYLICKYLKYKQINRETTVISRNKKWRELFRNIGIEAIEDFNFFDGKFDSAIECTGDEGILSRILKQIDRGGHITLVGIPEKGRLIKYRKIQDKSLTISGVQMYNRKQFEIAVTLVSNGFDASEIFSSFYPISESHQAFKKLIYNKSEETKIALYAPGNERVGMNQ